MKQQLQAAYRTASRRFTEVIRSRVLGEVQEVLVPTEQNKTAVCIIMKSGVFMFQPSQEYHKTKRALSRPKGAKRLNPQQHIDVCNRTIDKLLELYRQDAEIRLRKGYSRRLTRKEEEMYYARRAKQSV